MRINSHDLLGLPVVTAIGKKLGKIISFDIDVESHAIIQYDVGPRNWPRALTHYLVAPEQVVSITAEQMTVKDGVVPAAEERVPATASVARISPLATRDR